MDNSASGADDADGAGGDGDETTEISQDGACWEL
jgi:hypothetical protein